MSTIHKSDRTVTSCKPKKKPSGGPRGNMKPAEIKPLIMAARRAFDCQKQAGLVDCDFDSWRKIQVSECVGKSGLTACNHEDFRPILAHFQTLAGDDSSAFENLMTSGNVRDHAAPGDTHEARRQISHAISEALLDHLHLAESSIDQLVAESVQEWDRLRPGVPYPGPDPEWIASVRSRKAAISAHGKGPISVGYLIFLVRQKTRRPDLHLGPDWQAGLAERCTARQLSELRATLINRINAVEGLGSAAARNKRQRRLADANGEDFL